MNIQKRDWAKIIEDFKASGKSVKEFSASKGFHPNTVSKYRKLYQEQPLEEIPVKGIIGASPIVVHIDDYTVNISTGFDRTCLKSVIEVLGEIG
jgi:hypothetical protein